MRFLLALLFIATMVPGMRPASAQPFDKVIVFGDSNVDTGYYKLIAKPTGNATYDAYWPARRPPIPIQAKRRCWRPISA
jgi:phospholipase/lecithinase/hemolysin